MNRASTSVTGATQKGVVGEVADSCFRVEYDETFFGGNYAGTGQFAYVPFSLMSEEVEPEDAFERHTGISRQHIIHYSLDDSYDAQGNSIEV